MSHPNKSSAASAHTAKLRKMTKDYGMAGGVSQYETSPQSRLKAEGPEDAVGFGADSSKVSARSDKPARRSAAANPLATYAKGGKVKHRAEGGGIDSPFSSRKKRREAAEEVPIEIPQPQGGGPKGNGFDDSDKRSTGGVIARARGGRAKGATHVNVIIAPQGQPQGAGLGDAMNPQLAALAAGKPPMAPPAPPPMAGPPPGAAPPMMPPQGGPPMPMRAKGGRVKGEMETPDHNGLDEDKRDLIADTLREEGLIRRARGGGITMTAGAANGVGRLEKMGITARHRGSMTPKDI